MSSTIERQTNEEKLSYLISESCMGNKAAENYLYQIAFVARILDDLIDKDHEVKNEDICRAFFIMIAEMLVNPFFVSNAHILTGIHVAAFNAWMDATAWEIDNNDLKRHYAHVMREFINELIAVVAFLTGGYSHMRRLSLATKEVFLKEVG